MRKFLFTLLVAAASCTVRPAFASISADLTLTVTGGKLWAYVGLKGIADCPTTGSVTVEFTSPDETLFVSSSYEAPWRSCALETGEARTRAYRTLAWTNQKGKRYTAIGTWKVRVLTGTTVLAEGAYTVKS